MLTSPLFTYLLHASRAAAGSKVHSLHVLDAQAPGGLQPEGKAASAHDQDMTLQCKASSCQTPLLLIGTRPADGNVPFYAQVATDTQFYKWFQELADRGLIPRGPGYEEGAKLPPPDQVELLILLIC